MTLDRLTAALSDRYRIEREIGAGGMATVYLAHDIKHDRKVAIKVLRPELAAVIGAERFLSEIKTTANLQHPHILALFDSGVAITPPMIDDRSSIDDHRSSSFLFYVMPFIEGESLRDRLTRDKQLPIRDAIRIATEVAGALDYAHRHGIIHRDIKPENILLHDGRALVADFGIALAASTAGARMTETGMSLGTPTYMSPEQAMGERTLDARTDVYALGCVTYEMLVGDPPFLGSTAQAIVAKVMTEKPALPSRLRDTVAEHVDDAVLTALEKLPADRFATAAEFAAALAGGNVTSAGTRTARATVRGAGPWQRVSAALAIAFVVLGVAAVLGWTRTETPGVVRRFYITMSQYSPDFGNPVMSPDGSRLVYSDTEGALMMRRGDDLIAKQIPGSDAAWAAVFSPDSRAIAINNGFPGALKIIPLDGGPVRTLVADSTYGSGIAWGDDGWLYYLHGEDYGRDLMRIRATGGPAEFVARPDSTTNALFFYWPQILPGGKKLLLVVVPTRGEPSVGVLDVASGKVTVIATGVKAHYTATGHLLVVQGDGELKAARFDPKRGEVIGNFVTVGEGLYTFSSASQVMALSDDGTLVYQPTPAAGQVVRIFREDGRQEVIDPEWGGSFGSLALSPDGGRLAVGVGRGGRTELWVKSLGDGTFVKLSAGGTQNYRPSWSPDGREVVFTSDQNGKITTYRVPADGSGQPRRLLTSVTKSVDEAAYSRDGQWIVFRGGSGGGRDIHAIRAAADASPTPLVAGPAEEFSPALSPDGRWLAYASDETGRTEVYVRPFPDAGSAKYPVSRNGGSEPLWSPAGGELFYRNGAENLVAVQVAPGDAFRATSERVLFSTHDYATDNRHHAYAVAADGRSFIFIRTPVLSGAPNQLIITLNWFEELKRKVGK